MSMKRKILVIDDDREAGDFICTVAEEKGFRCTVTTEAPEFVGNLGPDVDLIFLDLVMPGVDGIELLRHLALQQWHTGIVLVSGVGRRILEAADETAKALGLVIVGHLNKPYHLVELEALLDLQYQAAPGPPAPSPAPKTLPITELELFGAIDREEFTIHYQPQIEIQTGKVVGVEALVRWLHPTRGLIFPDHFIGLMEILGLIDQLGNIVTNRALRDVVRFANQDGAIPMISINISVRSLRDLKFPDDLEFLAKTHGVPAAKITLEITETGLIKELARTLDVLTRLRMKAIQLSIDDFGTGYSMMQQLRHIPATEIKIDRIFVQNMTVADGDRVMVLKTIEIGHDLGMKVVAEGVETKEQLDFLAANGCDLAQGYLFSPPLPAEDLVIWLRRYRATLPVQTERIGNQ